MIYGDPSRTGTDCEMANSSPPIIEIVQNITTEIWQKYWKIDQKRL